MANNRNLYIIALVTIVNALGYGIVIPILYPYSIKFGLNDFQNGMLFALFSLCQFLATPFIGRLSDKYGRRPLLLISIFGTSLSFFMAAFAPNAIFLFIARALDGITAGNIPVASAVISDSTNAKNRAKGFGIIAGSFSFGFVFGPAISGFTAGWGLHIPFIIAGVIALIAVIITAIYLPETNKHIGEVQHGKLFDFKKLLESLTYPNVGLTLRIALIYSIGFAMFIYAFNPFSVKIMQMNPTELAFTFTLYGIIGVIAQFLLIGRVSKRFGEKKTLEGALIILAISFIANFFVREWFSYILVIVIQAVSNAFIMPLLQTALSKETDDKSQGSIQGIYFSLSSIGNIIGPIISGGIATISVLSPFGAAALLCLMCFAMSFNILRPGIKKESAFEILPVKDR